MSHNSKSAVNVRSSISDVWSVNMTDIFCLLTALDHELDFSQGTTVRSVLIKIKAPPCCQTPENKGGLFIPTMKTTN